MAIKRTFHFKNYLICAQSRCYGKLVREQDPEETTKMPIFEYATENTKRRKRVYVWGNALFGALGKINFIKPANGQKPLKSMHFPWRLSFAELHRVRDIACGYGFTVFAASNDENDFSLFGVGLNTDFQIGYHCKRKNHPLEIIGEPVPIALPLYNSNTKAIKVACGRAHTIVLTDKEGIFSLGNNTYGQCGVLSNTAERKEDLIKVHKVEGIDEDIVEVVCGQDHTLLLSTSGKVYSFGWGADGQTGLGNYNNQFTPAMLKGDIEGEKIVQLSCAADCVLAVSSKGDVFGWGNSEYRQLNLATEKQQINVPTYLNLNLGKITQVASGGTICAVVNEKGNVHVWGYGILGQGPNVSSSKIPTLLPQPLFGANEFNSDVKVKQIVCGLNHFAALTNHHHLFMWGKNRSDCLGLGKNSGDQFFPYKVPVPSEVLKVSCGVDHTAALCRSFI
ncbi:RCC1-like G exchanging factor-like protein [Parasteatoda tepidariorum]|uniref:RCC1-like G exchanging factor-like protein n=1 Tax=Parasteatoda tepidariorum TaxID=114398 RepID=UPI001C729528|nr:RCC1-like G exchanging factor-like protein [Parasteatoda tepidariorum]XP_042908665.1 RCC1-like G exchanging factor-like protein [Parasteatoda tepidariorum]